jgi:hypothetical protein
MRNHIKNRKSFRIELIKKVFFRAVQIITPATSSMFQKTKLISLTGILQVVCSLAIFLSVASLTQAQVSGPEYNMTYNNGLLTLSAKQVNLKRLLSHLAETLNIYISYPRDLDKQITIRLYNVPPIKALRRILKGQNYALIYSASKPKKASAISELYILPKPISHGAAGKYQKQRSRDKRIQASIKNYEKKLERLKDRLAKIDSESPAGRSISKRIRSTERTIERLQKKLER